MRRTLFALAFILVASLAVAAQKGTAEEGYYQMGYAGDTWTGEVASVNPETHEITLVYRKKNKTQTFVGLVRDGWTGLKMKRPGEAERDLKDTDIPLGTVFKVYYMQQKKKVGGQEVKYNLIIKMKPLPPEKQK